MAVVVHHPAKTIVLQWRERDGRMCRLRGVPVPAYVEINNRVTMEEEFLAPPAPDGLRLGSPMEESCSPTELESCSPTEPESTPTELDPVQSQQSQEVDQAQSQPSQESEKQEDPPQPKHSQQSDHSEPPAKRVRASPPRHDPTVRGFMDVSIWELLRV